MSDFRELSAPKETTKYAYTGWFIATEPKPGAAIAWLTTAGDMTSNKSNMSILFFTTELEALEAGFNYYHKHGKIYPHASMGFTIGTMNNDGSQVMGFE